MNRFKSVLLDLDSRLLVKEPARSRVLLEVAADMDDLYQEFLHRGLEEADAEAAVIDHFDLSDEVLRDLVGVHDTPLQRSLETLSVQVRNPWSRFLMVFLALSVTIGYGGLLLRGQAYHASSGLVWIVMPIFALGLVIAAGSGRRAYQPTGPSSPLFRPDSVRLLGLAVLIVVVTAAGLWVELYLSALRIRAVPGEAVIHLVGWLHMAAATLVIALSCALILGFFWFFLETRVRRRELTAAANLLEGF
jgi:hypothetical protein